MADGLPFMPDQKGDQGKQGPSQPVPPPAPLPRGASSRLCRLLAGSKLGYFEVAQSLPRTFNNRNAVATDLGRMFSLSHHILKLNEQK